MDISSLLNKIVMVLTDLYSPIAGLWNTLGSVLISIVIAVIFLAISVWILSLLRTALEWVLDLLRIDTLADLLGINRLLGKVSSLSFCDILVSILYWIALAGIFISTINLLGVGKNVTKTINYFSVVLLPNLLSAVLILVIAVLIAGFVGNLVKLITSYFTSVNSELLAKAASFVIILYAVIAAINYLDIIPMELLNTALIIAFIGFALSAALGLTKESAATVKALAEKVKETFDRKPARRK